MESTGSWRMLVPIVQSYVEHAGYFRTLIPAVVSNGACILLQNIGTWSSLRWSLQVLPEHLVPVVESQIGHAGSCRTLVPAVEFQMEPTGSCRTLVPAVEFQMEPTGYCRTLVPTVGSHCLGFWPFLVTNFGTNGLKFCDWFIGTTLRDWRVSFIGTTLRDWRVSFIGTTLRDWRVSFIGTTLRDWRVSFPNSPAVVQITLCSGI